MSALRTGCDLVTVHCADEATIPLKSYSPELMVEGIYSAKDFDSLLAKVERSAILEDGESEEGLFIQQSEVIQNEIYGMVHKVMSSFDRLHAIIIGPGLGRCPIVLEATSIILQKAMEANLNIVLDADGLFLLSNKKHWDIFCNGILQKQSTSKVILTPNVVEYKRLVETMGEGSEDTLKAKLRGVTIIQKGHEDVITYFPKPDEEPQSVISMICSERGGLKRSGGLGT